MAYVARAVCVRWTYYGVSRLARGDGMLWVAGGQQRGPRRARACMCVPRTCELSVSDQRHLTPRSRACKVHVMGAHYNVA